MVKGVKRTRGRRNGCGRRQKDPRGYGMAVGGEKGSYTRHRFRSTRGHRLACGDTCDGVPMSISEWELSVDRSAEEESNGDRRSH